MNAVEIEAAVSDLAAEPFHPAEFPFQFLAAFDKKETQLKRLRKGDSNKSDVQAGDSRAVLLQANIHIAVCAPGETRSTLERLKASPQTAKAKAKFVLATDGVLLEAEDLLSHEAIAVEYPDFAQKIGFFLPLAGISTVREIKDNPIDVRATGRLNKLYVELLRQNPEWGTDARRHAMNHFMARLIFCFFAEDTDIFPGGSGLFTSTIQQWTESDGGNTHAVLETLFRVMNTAPEARDHERLPGWAVTFPFVNGGLFCDAPEAPRFTRIARSYLLQAGALDWKHINPDIFGSMIQAVADDAERGALGMHYTSVPNILKVLNPLFLDDLRDKLAAAGDNRRTLRALRTRLSRIRVFDPACGSGNFLVIAYKQLREIEADIDRALDERPTRSVLSLRNFRGIEIRDFAVEIARLALVIAEYQSNVLYLGEQQARLVFLPLSSDNWITCGNALRLDWLTVCPPEGGAVVRRSDDLFQDELEQTGLDFDNEGGETYICGNPPYLGSAWQTADQRRDLRTAVRGKVTHEGLADYVSGWYVKAVEYGQKYGCDFAFVSTNSLNQGQQVPVLWPYVLKSGYVIKFARPSFEWRNLATYNAGVIVTIVGLTHDSKKLRKLIYDEGVIDSSRVVESINAYLVAGPDIIVKPIRNLRTEHPEMLRGNTPIDGGNLLLTPKEYKNLRLSETQKANLCRRFLGSAEAIRGLQRYCLWITESKVKDALDTPELRERFKRVKEIRESSSDKGARDKAAYSYQMREMRFAESHAVLVPRHSSENRMFLPFLLLEPETIVGDSAFAIYDAPHWAMALLASRMQWVWVSAVCGKIKNDFRYSSTLGWNAFPYPSLSEADKADLTRCAEDILLAREAHFPATIADLYAPDAMPDNLRAAHDRNDETLERIYLGRRFRNDTERLETLFTMYAKMTEKQSDDMKGAGGKRRAAPKQKQVLRSAQDDNGTEVRA